MSFTNKLAAFAQDKKCLSAHQYGYVITALEVPGPNTEFP
ncbi:hypothetical protein AA0115_g11700 [Alternaria tenuissima]|uniref:Uncharacterized protein n=1 Tax=Alternaria tenuissima TaxID=119927 RepID=A0AB37W1S6_9PLEO|nr:hypothetical protein AA0115_g11700 [Alternaria tenuissima]